MQGLGRDGGQRGARRGHIGAKVAVLGRAAAGEGLRAGAAGLQGAVQHLAHFGRQVGTDAKHAPRLGARRTGRAQRRAVVAGGHHSQHVITQNQTVIHAAAGVAPVLVKRAAAPAGVDDVGLVARHQRRRAHLAGLVGAAAQANVANLDR